MNYVRGLEDYHEVKYICCQVWFNLLWCGRTRSCTTAHMFSTRLTGCVVRSVFVRNHMGEGLLQQELAQDWHPRFQEGVVHSNVESSKWMDVWCKWSSIKYSKWHVVAYALGMAMMISLEVGEILILAERIQVWVMPSQVERVASCCIPICTTNLHLAARSKTVDDRNKMEEVARATSATCPSSSLVSRC